jgi:DNA polymerase III delta prime subunit
MDYENPAPTEKVLKYWLEFRDEKPVFIFVQPTADGKCSAIFNLTTNQKMTAVVYYHNCRQFTPFEYVMYKCLGYI